MRGVSVYAPLWILERTLNIVASTPVGRCPFLNHPPFGGAERPKEKGSPTSMPCPHSRPTNISTDLHIGHIGVEGEEGPSALPSSSSSQPGPFPFPLSPRSRILVPGSRENCHCPLRTLCACHHDGRHEPVKAQHHVLSRTLANPSICAYPSSTYP